MYTNNEHCLDTEANTHVYTYMNTLLYTLAFANLSKFVIKFIKYCKWDHKCCRL